jgi:hypothetical protein
MRTFQVISINCGTGVEREPDPWYRNCCVEVNNYRPVPFELIKEETEKLIKDGVIIIPKKERNKWMN